MTTTPASQTQRAQIVATVGPASASRDIFSAMVAAGLDVVRLNFAWGTLDERVPQIAMIREVAAGAGKHIPIIQDLPGPRVQEQSGHTYDHTGASLTEQDKTSIAFGAAHQLEYLALSFVGSAADVEECRAVVAAAGGAQKIIAKIERKVALEHIDAIIAASDAIMIARGDLGSEVPLEEIPFIEADLIAKTRAAGKPVITATQMLFSMIDHPTPSRAEVTDIEYAVAHGSDAVMLSDETAAGKYPVEAVEHMRLGIEATQRHEGLLPLHLL